VVGILQTQCLKKLGLIFMHRMRTTKFCVVHVTLLKE